MEELLEKMLEGQEPLEYYKTDFENYNWTPKTLEDSMIVAAHKGNLEVVDYLLNYYQKRGEELKKSTILHDYLHAVIDWNCYSKTSQQVHLGFVDLIIAKGGALNKIEGGRTILDLAIDNENAVMVPLIQHLYDNYQPVAQKNSWKTQSNRFKKKYCY